MGVRRSSALIGALDIVRPGRPLRAGLQRVLLSRMGALVVVGDGPDVLALCSGGFDLDAAVTPERLSELAKMDGAIVLDAAAERLVRANVHLIPDPSLETSETGTRHRTAERVSRSTGVPVLAVSEEMSTITVYAGEVRRVLQDANWLAARANRLLQTLDRFRVRLDEVTAELTAAELDESATVRDVATALQRAEMVRRVADEVFDCLMELGDEGGLLRIQLAEALAGVDDERRLVLEDYLDESGEWDASQALARLADLSTDGLLDLGRVSAVLGPGTWDRTNLDGAVAARGFRVLGRVPKLGAETIGRIVTYFPDLQKVMRATTSELADAAGIEADQAEAVQEELIRLAGPGAATVR